MKRWLMRWLRHEFKKQRNISSEARHDLSDYFEYDRAKVNPWRSPLQRMEAELARHSYFEKFVGVPIELPRDVDVKKLDEVRKWAAKRAVDFGLEYEAHVMGREETKMMSFKEAMEAFQRGFSLEYTCSDAIECKPVLDMWDSGLVKTERCFYNGLSHCSRFRVAADDSDLNGKVETMMKEHAAKYPYILQDDVLYKIKGVNEGEAEFNVVDLQGNDYYHLLGEVGTYMTLDEAVEYYDKSKTSTRAMLEAL